MPWATIDLCDRCAYEAHPMWIHHPRDWSIALVDDCALLLSIHSRMLHETTIMRQRWRVLVKGAAHCFLTQQGNTSSVIRLCDQGLVFRGNGSHSEQRSTHFVEPKIVDPEFERRFLNGIRRVPGIRKVNENGLLAAHGSSQGSSNGPTDSRRSQSSS